MLRIFKNPQFPFMKYRYTWLAVSGLLLLAGVAAFVVRGGFNYGIDFAGGTQIAAKFREPMDIGKLRGILEGAGFKEATIQHFDDPALNEFLVRVHNIEGREGDTVSAVLDTLARSLNAGAASSDLNLIGTKAVADLLSAGASESPETVQAVAEAIATLKKDKGILISHADLKGINGLTPALFDVLKQKTTVGPFSILSSESVGPKVGKDLQKKAIWAVLGSLVGMLLYIAFRFKHLSWGAGAIAAIFHDVLIMLGFMCITNRPLDLTGIAALLTLMGYSMNDTVIVFDRIRENMRLRKPGTLLELMDRSINETLSRTIITSGLTWVVVACLFFLGGDVINNFAFIMFWGILIGTYSSIYIASPLAWAFTHLGYDRTAKKK
jgi:preprotein translocase subunit SecF